jgi:hypothetical protein
VMVDAYESRLEVSFFGAMGQLLHQRIIRR